MRNSRLLIYNKGQYMHFNKSVKPVISLSVKAYLEVCLLKSQGTKELSLGSNADAKIIMISNLFSPGTMYNLFYFILFFVALLAQSI